MNAPQQVVVSPDIEIKMQDVLKAQRESYLQEGYVSAEARIDRLNRAIDVLAVSYTHLTLPTICSV